MKKYLIQILSLLGLTVSFKRKNIILQNLYGTNYNKHVLISYLKAPFLTAINYSHSNFTECKTAADIFNELHYNVDIIDFTEKDSKINYNKYDIVYGFGYALEQSFYSDKSERLLKICYSTGCNPFYSFKQSANRVNDFYSKTGLMVPQSSRIGDYFWAFQYISSDLVIALGNDFVAETFRATNPNINVKALNAFYFDTYDIDINKKDFSKAKKNFLWFGSSGLLHKGLDLVIDIFSKRTDLTLHICGATKGERKFFEYYKPIIDNCPNIIDYNFIDIQSENFKLLMNTCAAVIFPSVSEGGAVSLLNVIANGGLIPIISRSSGVDLGAYDKFVFDEVNASSIEKNIENFLQLTDRQISDYSNIYKRFIRETYNHLLYKANLKAILQQISHSA